MWWARYKSLGHTSEVSHTLLPSETLHRSRVHSIELDLRSYIAHALAQGVQIDESLSSTVSILDFSPNFQTCGTQLSRFRPASSLSQGAPRGFGALVHGGVTAAPCD